MRYGLKKKKLISYIIDCIKKVLDDKKSNDISSIWNEGKIDLLTDIANKFNLEYFDYSDRDNAKVKNGDKFKVILSECSEIEVILKLILHEEITKNKYDISLLEKYEKRINTLLVYASLILSFHSFNEYRTEESTKKLRSKRKIEETLVQEAYLKWLKENPNKETLKLLSERKMARTIKQRVENDLKAKKINSISEQTIINILRNRDKSKLPTYPWENKRVSKTLRFSQNA